MNPDRVQQLLPSGPRRHHCWRAASSTHWSHMDVACTMVCSSADVPTIDHIQNLTDTPSYEPSKINLLHMTSQKTKKHAYHPKTTTTISLVIWWGHCSRNGWNTHSFKKKKWAIKLRWYKPTYIKQVTIWSTSIRTYLRLPVFRKSQIWLQNCYMVWRIMRVIQLNESNISFHCFYTLKFLCYKSTPVIS